jgi:hypothetical protein
MYTIQVSGYGKHIAVGRIGQEVYSFWNSYPSRNAVKAQLFPDATPGFGKSPIPDTADPLFLNVWNANSDVLIIKGTFPESTHLIVTADDGTTVWATDEFNIEFARKYRKQANGSGYYVKSWHDRKGIYSSYIINDNEFDPAKLNYYATEVDGDIIMNKISYDNTILKIKDQAVSTVNSDYLFFEIG